MAVKFPFQPSVMDALPEELAELFRGLELTLLKEICSRLKIADQLNEVTVQDIRALRSHGIDLESIKKAIEEATGTGADKLEKILDDVVERNQVYYTEMITLADVTAPERLISHEDTWAIYEQTKGQYRNITQSMGFLVRQGRHRVMLEPAKAYQWALDQALLQVQSGAISYNQAITTAIRQLADGGLCVAYDKNGDPIPNRVAYESKTTPGKQGHVDHLDVAVRRAVQTAVNSLNQKYREQSMDYLETDLVETTAHIGARNTGSGYLDHQSWQGKIYHWRQYGDKHRGKYPDFEDVCGTGEGGGIGGWNCRHSYHPYIDGVMEPTYSASDLEKLKAENNKCTFEGKEYDGYQKTQMQRSVERAIRKQKRRKAAFEAAGQDKEAQAASIKLRLLNQKYKAFSKAAGLPEQRERMKVLYP